MKKFEYIESNLCIDMGIRVERLKKKLNKKLDSGEISIEEYRIFSEKIDQLIKKNLEILENWQEQL